MEPALLDEVPSLDLADYTSGDATKKEKFVADLGSAFTNIGFVAIKNHGLNDDLRIKLYDAVQRFFMLPEAQKRNTNILNCSVSVDISARGRKLQKVLK